jgi:hypothetical protein
MRLGTCGDQPSDFALALDSYDAVVIAEPENFRNEAWDDASRRRALARPTGRAGDSTTVSSASEASTENICPSSLPPTPCANIDTLGKQNILQQLPKFMHSPLPTSKYSRVLVLHPGQVQDDLFCHLESAHFESISDDYIALSYVWGDPTVTHGIICDGMSLQVTQNVAEALRALRDPIAAERIWIDAICIDQANNMEKNQQVQRMGNIYMGAREVVVWLGRDEEAIAQDCFDLVRSTNAFLDNQLERFGNVFDIPALVSPCPICDDRSRWEKVRKMVTLSWFTRVWVIQEVGLAKKCIFRWGDHEIDIAQVMELALWVIYREDLAELSGHVPMLRLTDLFRDVYCSYDNPVTWRTSLPLIRKEVENYESQLFMDVLLAASGMGATDKRDHVFAFLGSPLAVTEDGKPLIKPDYNKSLSEVFYDTACAFLRHPREAPYLLSRVKHLRGDEDQDQDRLLPSWVPCWDRSVEFCISRPHFWFQAGGEKRFSPTILPDCVLKIHGIQISRLKFLSRVIENRNLGIDPNEWDEEYRSVRKPFIDVLWEEIADAAITNLTQLEIDFSWTLVRAYPASKGRTPDAQHQAEFEAYRSIVRRGARSVFNMRNVEKDIEDPLPRDFFHRLSYCDGLAVTLLESGRIGLVPNLACLGDLCCVIPGIPVPLILRPLMSGNYSLIGESYLNGIMSGEAIEWMESGGAVEESFCLV